MLIAIDWGSPSRKYAYIILTPLKSHFYIAKPGFTGVYIIFLISAQNHSLWYSLEPPHRGGSNEYPQSMFLSRNVKNISVFYLKIFSFLEVKFSKYLNRHVFIMQNSFILPSLEYLEMLVVLPFKSLRCADSKSFEFINYVSFCHSSCPWDFPFSDNFRPWYWIRNCRRINSGHLCLLLYASLFDPRYDKRNVGYFHDSDEPTHPLSFQDLSFVGTCIFYIVQWRWHCRANVQVDSTNAPDHLRLCSTQMLKGGFCV